jgi:4-amino-4-deoxy-L-arabinose transferase-like glycosyltransferase
MRIKFVIPALLILYTLLLLINLTKLPIYLDEGLYIFWAYLFSQSDGFAYISMQDGKTPLFIWLTAWVNPYLNNFLFSGRFISVVSLISWLIIGGKMLGRKSLIFIVILFLAAPFNILISRLAFVDSLLIAFGSLSILGIFLAKESAGKKWIIRTILFAILSGLFLGLAFLTKTTAKIFLLGEILVLIFWGFDSLKIKQFKSAGLIALSGIIISGLYFEIMGYLKFGALRHWEMVANKESVLVFSLEDLYRKFFVEFNYSAHIKNLPINGEYFLFYFGPLLFFFAAGIFWMLKNRKHLWTLILVLVFAGGVFLSARVPASRYLAIIIPEVLVISAFGLMWIWQQKLKSFRIISVFLILISGFMSFKMLFDPLGAFYSSDDRANFVDYNLNGLGLIESVEFLLPKKDYAAVAVTGIWGVAEGAKVAFDEKGIESYSTQRVVTVHEKQEFCEEDYKELRNRCWKIDFGDVTKSSKPEKYVYFINEQIDMDTLKRLEKIEVVKEFKRPTNLNVYLIKLVSDN